VSQHLNRTHRIDAEAAAGLAQHLESFATTLPELERAILNAMIHAALSPHDRMRARPASEVLDHTEQRVLDALLVPRGKEGGRWHVTPA
jgi:hypothetical protein